VEYMDGETVAVVPTNSLSVDLHQSDVCYWLPLLK
jgi:hypothetical protein